jgi:hypothetical protein
LYYYQAFGLVVRSEIHLPELLPEAEGSHDVSISYGRLEGPRPADGHPPVNTWVAEKEAYYAYSGIGSFSISNGNSILIDPMPGVAEKDLRPFLLGNAFGALIFQRGHLVLHGSAVAVGNQAIVFLSHSGQGKSTMAAALVSQFPLITDDIVAIGSTASNPVVFSAFPRLKLHPEAGKAIQYEFELISQPNTSGEKILTRPTGRFAGESFPLKRIYILEKGDSIDFQDLKPQEAILELIRYTYTLGALRAKVNIARHFSQCADVVGKISTRRLIRPFDFKTLPAVIRGIHEDLKVDG